MNIICIAIGLGALSVEPTWTPKEPEILPEIEAYFRAAYARMRQLPASDDEADIFEEPALEAMEEVRLLFGKETAFLNGLFLYAGIEADVNEDWMFRQIVGSIVRGLPESPEETCELVAPYWPPEHARLKEVIGGLLGSISATDNPERFNTDFSIITEVLSSAWANNNHAYDGLVDYMFEGNAIMAWLALLEMEGWEPEALDQHYDTTIVFARPYRNQRARTDPSRVDPQVLDECRALLHEFVHDDSLWARVFAAEILNKVPYMRDPDIEAALREDPHWLIQRRMAYLDEAAPEAEQE